MNHERSQSHDAIMACRDAFHQAVHNELPQNVAAEVMARALPAARMSLTSAHDSTISVGHSKYGGHPDVPESFEWPHVTARLGHKAEQPYPLTFAFQINFAEVADILNADSIWPRSGLLLVFFDALTAPSLNCASDRSGIKIFYVPTGCKLTRTSPPWCVPPVPSDKSKIQIASHAILFEPAWRSPEMMLIKESTSEIWNRFSEEDRGQYFKWWGRHFAEDTKPNSFIGGHTVALQGDRISSTTKRAFGFFESFDDKGKRVGEKQVADPLPESDGDWRLLVQFDFEDSNITQSFVYEGVRFYIFVSEKCIKSRSFGAAVWTWDQD